MKIKIKDLSKKFNNDVVFSNLNIEFESGKIYGIVGRNGSGKSVLLKMIAGLYLEDSGEILFNNINYNKEKKFPENVGIVIESPSFISDLTGFDNLKLLANLQKKVNDEEILNTMRIVNLEQDKYKKYGKYSLGMKQKLSLAQAFMENPNIILLDEPFNGIDRQSVVKIKDYLKKMRNNDKLIIITTHISDDIENFADKVLYLEDGSFYEKSK
ncbi:MAG: ABC transporter ATP-binding protein [bacterium]|nr:ABC transporter ATP-binding protein [bacterium]